MPVKLPAPVDGTAAQAEPNGAEDEPALIDGLPVLEAEAEVGPEDGAALVEVLAAAAADGLLELLPHALALTAMAAEHSTAAAVLLRVENMIRSLIRGVSGSC
nr:hypothetical protein [Catenulispora pinisilvae]